MSESQGPNSQARQDRRVSDMWARYDKRVRDSIIFLVGVGGCINELFVEPEPRPAAMVFLASLIGVPFVLSADEKKSLPPPPDGGNGQP